MWAWDYRQMKALCHVYTTVYDAWGGHVIAVVNACPQTRHLQGGERACFIYSTRGSVLLTKMPWVCPPHPAPALQTAPRAPSTPAPHNLTTPTPSHMHVHLAGNPMVRVHLGLAENIKPLGITPFLLGIKRAAKTPKNEVLEG